LSKKIAVEGEADPLQAHVARRLVKRGLARWRVRGASIVRLKERERTLRDIAADHQRQISYALTLPPGLPLAELPGLKFEPPANATPQFSHTVFPDLPSL
jgi:hypothetical protein